MSIREDIEIFTLVYQRQIVLAIPPECLVLIEKAKQDDIPVRDVFILNHPLLPLTGGQCDTREGDIWVLFRQEQKDGLLKAQQSLLHELAHLDCPPRGRYQTIDDDWNEERETWKRAHALAIRWGVESIFPEEALDGKLNEVEQFREDHWAAGLLAGSLCPGHARRAYRALSDIRRSQFWSHELFSQALCGYSADPFANAVVVDFNRVALRGTWRGVWRCGGSFGSHLTLPQSEKSASDLRSLLERNANRIRLPQPPTWRNAHNTALCFFEPGDSDELGNVLFWVQRLLLDYDDEQMSASVTWWLYADDEGVGLPHLYRLTISYGRSWGTPDGDSSLLCGLQDPQDVEVWILFTGHSRRGSMLEAVWQRYLVSWLSVQELRHEPLRDGMSQLIHWLR